MDEKPAATGIKTTLAGAEPGTLPPAPPPRIKKKKMPFILGAVGLIVIVAVVIYYIQCVAPYESTDDAFIENHVTIVSPRVSGPVVKLLVDDNQIVQQGDLLVEIDPSDYETKVTQAQADLKTAQGQLEQAKAQITVDQAKADQDRAQEAASEADAIRAKADLQRYSTVEARAISGTQLDLAQAQAKVTIANVNVATNLTKAADAQVALSRVNAETAEAVVKQAEAKLHQAELDLSYTKITAPVSGRVTRRTVEQGAYLQVSQSLLALVPKEVWVVANFKETQLANMRPGQPVTMTIDAYPKRKFKGKVQSLQAGTGARFSLLPAENAVGNYVKVVQRIPVKIVFDEPLDAQLDIAPGMSVVPEVKVK
ncbi:MAG TPA: HlyD family secretion protein [Verrucomicrobiae bacterium]|nr:HlyD family secretion protein [Verrucomicrobiae bacterium]